MEKIDLKVHEDKMLEFSNKISKLEKEVETSATTIKNLKSENVELNEKITKMEEEKVIAEKNASYEKLFNDGKISKVQLDALKEGKDLMEVLSLNGKLHTEATGGDQTPEVTSKLTEEEKEFCVKMNLTEEEYVKYNS